MQSIELGHPSSTLGHLGLPVLGPVDSNWDLHHWLLSFLGLRLWTGTTPLAFLGLQLVEGRALDFSASITT